MKCTLGVSVGLSRGDWDSGSEGEAPPLLWFHPIGLLQGRNRKVCGIFGSSWLLWWRVHLLLLVSADIRLLSDSSGGFQESSSAWDFSPDPTCYVVSSFLNWAATGSLILFLKNSGQYNEVSWQTGTHRILSSCVNSWLPLVLPLRQTE